MQKTIIRDAVHGQIELTSTEQKIIDSTDFQRLRGIKQVGMTYLVYPGAHHTRFEHSLGALFLASKMGEKLGLNGDDLARLRLAALLHDLGHTPLSHDSEHVLKSRLGDHEKIGEAKINALPLRDIIAGEDSPKKISKWAFGSSFGKAITSDVGADRLDYLLRDAHYTGVAYGVIDWGRIISTIKWHSKSIAIEQGGLEAAESVMLARFSMFHTVYYHHAVRIARAMFQHSLKTALENKDFNTEMIKNEADSSLFARLWRLPYASKYIGLLSNRQLFKRAAVIKWKDIPNPAKKYASKNLEQDLQNKLGGDVLVSIPSDFRSKGKTAILSAEGKLSLDEASPISSSLQRAARERATLLVCSPKNLAKQAKNEAIRLLGI